MKWWPVLALIIGITILFAPIPSVIQEQVQYKPSLFQKLLGRISKSGTQGELNRRDSCERLDGTWLEKYQECEHINRQICANFGGRFNECASPCRHDPTADKCITLCVAVCTFP